MNERDFVSFLREIVRTMEGDGTVEKLDRMAGIQKEVFTLMNDQKELPEELVKEWNNTVRELYPEDRE